ncbi:MAG: 5'-nucleotidase C-terminal domain-containing protein [Deltaproteobacteria bacterium]
MKKIKLFSLLFLTIVLSLAVLYWQQQPIELVILHTNDHHGYCWSQDSKGGLAKQLTVIKQARKKYKNVLLLSAGDVNSGAPEADLFQGEPSFRGMNLMKFDAMAVGNHEFDNDLSAIKKQESLAQFPFLAANIYDKKTGQRIFSPYIIKKIGRLRVAIFGLTTEKTPEIVHEKNVWNLEFRNPIDETKKVLSEVKSQADFIIAVTHLGYYPEEPHESDGIGDIHLAKANPEIDLIVGGHSHTLLKEPVVIPAEAGIHSKTVIVQAFQYAKNIGELRLRVDGDHIESYEYMMHELDEKIADDIEMTALLEPYLAKAKSSFDVVVGEAKVTLNGRREDVRSSEANLGNLISDVIRKVTKADVALQNGGGIRASIEKGKVTYGDILKAFPFGNQIVTVKLNGKELLDILNRSASLTRPAGGFLQVSGISFIIKKDFIENVRVQGSPLKLDKVYTIATSDFVAQGGDGYLLFKKKEKENTGISLSEALKNYFQSRPSVMSRVENRILIH